MAINNHPRVPVREQAANSRRSNFDEVCFGYNLEEAQREAQRCLECKNPRCVAACPVSIDIPAFIGQVKQGNIAEAAAIIAHDSCLPAVCGRVCPQETQCEGSCVRGIKGEPVAIGKLERFVADTAQAPSPTPAQPQNKRVAIVGSGPAGLACASDLAKWGYSVTVFDALHVMGGVLQYGIPEFRLPKSIVQRELNALQAQGVQFVPNVIVGRTMSIDALMETEGYSAVFVGSGAGLPKFMGIEGENLNGVVSANEFLTRVNLMRAFDPEHDTPVFVGRRVAVVGGGNVAMDAARCAIRLGAEVHLVYRRSEAELPARVEEVHHAREEGMLFDMLTNPVQVLADDQGWVRGLRCIRMELGEPDASGRRRPVEVAGSEFDIEAEMVIMALGTSPNPLIASTTPGLNTERWGGIIANDSGATSREGVFAGGDAVSGAATVILAMGAGRKAARAIDEYLRK